jgi:lipopolysaccharide export system permease protein
MARLKHAARIIPILPRYIIQRILIAFTGILLVLLLALSMERLLRLVEEITVYNAPLSSALTLLLYLMPHYLGLAIPAALFLAVLFGVRRLHENSELVVIHAVGQSLQSVWMPVLALSGFIGLILFLIVAQIQPYARYAYRAHFQDMRTLPADISLRSGVFQKFGTQAVIRVDKFNPDNGAIQGFFATTENDRGERTIIGAQSGFLERLSDRSGFAIHLNNGQLITKKPGAKTSIVAFEKYPWSPRANQESYGARGQDEREMTLLELAMQKPVAQSQPEQSESEPPPSPAALRAELHARLAHVLSLPILTLLAVPLALIGRGRTQKAKGIILGVIVLVAYEKTLGFGESLAAAQTLSPWLSLWLPAIVLAGATGFWIRKRTQDI